VNCRRSPAAWLVAALLSLLLALESVPVRCRRRTMEKVGITGQPLGWLLLAKVASHRAAGLLSMSTIAGTALACCLLPEPDAVLPFSQRHGRPGRNECAASARRGSVLLSLLVLPPCRPDFRVGW
jgi:ABC-type transport system involved in cytochrome c biogenesis permease component